MLADSAMSETIATSITAPDASLTQGVSEVPGAARAPTASARGICEG